MAIRPARLRVASQPENNDPSHRNRRRRWRNGAWRGIRKRPFDPRRVTLAIAPSWARSVAVT
jgi:hypothetical protein